MAVESRAPASVPAPRSLRQRPLTRRAVLGAAIAGGAGVAALRLLGLGGGTLPGVGEVVNGGSDWISPLGSESAQVLQLLRRATFGAGPAEVEQALSDGFKKTLSRLLETPAKLPPPLPGADQASQTAPIRVGLLQKWWLDYIVTTPTPFAERMTLFWHGHFTSDYRKVGLQDPFLYWQNQTWRANALGDFRQFLYQVTIDPGMLRYLDLGTSTGQAPNENYARELMELFTMGPGNYTEDDVRAAARGLAGWREPRTAAMLSGARRPAPAGTAADPGKVGIFVPRRAYRGPAYAFLGRTAAFDTQGILDRVLAQPATAPFVTGRVIVNFLMPNPPAATVKRIAAGFVKSKWSIRQLMSDVFTSDEFRSAAAYRSLVKQPAEVMVQALRAVGGESLTALAVTAGSGMGQVLFDPPDVSGWPLNEGWVSSNTVIERVNFVTRLLDQLGSVPPAARAHLDQLDGVVSPATASLLNAATTDLERWTIVLASPEFQLK